MDYHCNNKFKSLQVNIQGRLLYNCHRAWPERLNLDWLEANPGMLFHTDTMLNDRKLMLENKSCASCHHGCYKYEEQGLLSSRLIDHYGEEKLINPNNDLEHLDIMLSSDCNLACVYCSPELSTSWQKEIANGGEYIIGNHKIKNDNFTLLWSKMKQKHRTTDTRFFSLLLREITLAKSLKEVTILGGEPLLSNFLVKLVKSTCDRQITKIEIISGLGVSTTRLTNILQKIKDKKIKFNISAESTNNFFEFIRYGNDWTGFKNKIDVIRSFKHDIEFISTISNISMFDYHNFHNEFINMGRIRINHLAGQPHLSPHVMDDLSKEKCRLHLKEIDDRKQREILSNMLSKNPSDTERTMLGSYLRQLSARRKIGLQFLPKNFLEWCGAIA